MRRFKLSHLSLISSALLGALILLWPQPQPLPPPELLDQVRHDLTHVRILPARPRILGYERSLFGDGWASTLHPTTGQLCTTRQSVLATAFHVRDCTRVGELGVGQENILDPYTGEPLDPTHTDIDHVFPLAAAWDLGAWNWTSQRRKEFANDAQLNLLAVDSTINRDKSDSTLSEWMPPNTHTHCHYAAKFLHVAATYQLAITEADAHRARHACEL